MTEEIGSLARFTALAQAYGGVIARWPPAERAAATRLAARPEAYAILAEAGSLDTMLDAWTVPAPTATLHDRVLRDAPRTVPRGGLRLWWSGLGIAVTLAGAAAGGVAAAAVAPADLASDNPTAFGDLTAGDS